MTASPGCRKRRSAREARVTRPILPDNAKDFMPGRQNIWAKPSAGRCLSK